MNIPHGGFLAEIADYFISRTKQEPPLENLCFILPNKRSAMFLKHHIRQRLDKISFMPRFMTMRTFISLHAAYPEAADRELLFLLYDAYRQVFSHMGREDSIAEFDSFIFWGDIILSDFDDIDRSLVNASEIFKNLKDLKDIQADYLDEDQKDVVRRIWGESLMTRKSDDNDTFWLHIAKDHDPDSLSGRFIFLWEILGKIYSRFHTLLSEKGMASTGAQYRQAAGYFKSVAKEELDPDTHYVMVGFNDLSTAETVIFDRLKDFGKVSFFWDTAPLALMDTDSDNRIGAKALMQLKQLARRFPAPPDFYPAIPEGPAVVDVVAIPSKIGNAKALSHTLNNWIEDNSLDTSNPTSGAIVIPEPSLLMPVLFSIPESVEAVNISLGLPYRSTNFAILLHDIISMQLRARVLRGTPHFYFEDVNAVLIHPHIRIIAGEEARKLAENISKNRIFNISSHDIAAYAPTLAPVFKSVKNAGDVTDVAEYLHTLLQWLSAKIAEKDDGHGRAFEIKAIEYFLDETDAIADLVAKYNISMGERTFLHMFERLFASRALSVNGTPLRGLQVLGVLETRALDFDNVVVLSMNEGVFPRRQYAKTMIPANLRAAFGLPGFDNLENSYAYSFYRLLVRAKHVSLFYDSRADALGGGEMSRYITQMKYLMPGITPKFHIFDLGAVPSEKMAVSVEKTPEVMKMLDDFRAGGKKRFSATALKAFRKCPLKFYLAYVRNMRSSDDMTGFISGADYGDIVHRTIQELFEPYRGKLIDASFYNRLLTDGNRTIDDLVRRIMIEICYPQYTFDDVLPAEGELGCDIVAAIVRADLKAELNCYCAGNESFIFDENEKKIDDTWVIDNNLSVRFYMSIDRVDKTADHTYRLIDFKTGAEETSLSLGGLFDADTPKSEGAFQLATYCQAFKDMEDSRAVLTPVIHPMRQLSKGEELVPVTIDKKAINDFTSIEKEFRPLLADMFRNIFDPKQPFSQCENPKRCEFCEFLTLCGRVVPKF